MLNPSPEASPQSSGRPQQQRRCRRARRGRRPARSDPVARRRLRCRAASRAARRPRRPRPGPARPAPPACLSSCNPRRRSRSPCMHPTVACSSCVGPLVTRVGPGRRARGGAGAWGAQGRARVARKLQLVAARLQVGQVERGQARDRRVQRRHQPRLLPGARTRAAHGPAPGHHVSLTMRGMDVHPGMGSIAT